MNAFSKLNLALGLLLVSQANAKPVLFKGFDVMNKLCSVKVSTLNSDASRDPKIGQEVYGNEIMIWEDRARGLPSSVATKINENEFDINYQAKLRGPDGNIHTADYQFEKLDSGEVVLRRAIHGIKSVTGKPVSTKGCFFYKAMSVQR